MGAPRQGRILPVFVPEQTNSRTTDWQNMQNTRPDTLTRIFFSYGFRPFFLLAILFASGAVGVWMAIYTGELQLEGPFSPTDWHIHEMLFAYTSAVIAGFLFTAIPNWTGRPPIQGWPLIGLTALWIAGRFTVAGAFDLNAVTVMIVDCAFMIGVGIIAISEIVAGKNWRNLIVIAPIAVFVGANILFHIEAWTTGAADIGRRLGFAAILFLIILIGGRIIPAFTRNWLAKSKSSHLPTLFNRFDGACIVASAVVLLWWSFLPEQAPVRYALVVIAALHLLRLSRWQGGRVVRSPILLMLHAAYAFLPLGFLALGLGWQSAGFHLLGIGVIGGMTVAVMIRASLGHTGRPLVAGPSLILSFCILLLAGLTRAFLPMTGLNEMHSLIASAVLWTLAYLIIIISVGPWLVRPKI